MCLLLSYVYPRTETQSTKEGIKTLEQAGVWGCDTNNATLCYCYTTKKLRRNTNRDNSSDCLFIPLLDILMLIILTELEMIITE